MCAKLKFILFFTFLLLFTVNLTAFGVEQSTSDHLGFINKFMINTDGYNFEILTVTNFIVSSHTFNASDKTLQFNIEASLEEGNVMEVTIPRELLDGEFTVLLDSEEVFYNLSNSNKNSVISIIFEEKGKHILEITGTKYLETVLNKTNGGGCLIATASFGSEMSPHVQNLRELRDDTVLQTKLGTTFMISFNQLYYSFSPTIADYERENPVFKEAVKLMLVPLLTSLTLLQYADIDSEHEMLAYGIGIIILNVIMYFVAPIVLIMKARKRVNIEKLDEEYA